MSYFSFAMYTCYTFLIVFALSLWPLWFAGSKHRKAVFCTANIVYFLVSVFAVNNMAKTKQFAENLDGMFSEAVEIAADCLSVRPGEIIRAQSKTEEEMRKKDADKTACAASFCEDMRQIRDTAVKNTTANPAETEKRG